MTGADGFAARLAAVRARIAAACARCGRDPGEVSLLPVSKSQPLAAIEAALAAGVRSLGENRVAELAAKAQAVAGRGVRWQMIGSLQTNKVRQLLEVPGLELIHSLDRRPLADELQRRGAGPIACLLQIAATGESSKHGVEPGDAASLLEHVRTACPAVVVDGLMAMGPRVGDPAPVFVRVAALAEELRQHSGLPLPVLSMGMSADLEAAVAAGATLVRVGTDLFGPRAAGETTPGA